MLIRIAFIAFMAAAQDRPHRLRSPQSRPAKSKTFVRVGQQEIDGMPILRTELYLDWQGKNRTAKIAWDTKERGVTSCVWQVSRFPFPSGSKNWEKPPGLVASGTDARVPVTGKPFPHNAPIIPIDFSTFGPQPGSKAVQAAPGGVGRQPVQPKIAPAPAPAPDRRAVPPPPQQKPAEEPPPHEYRVKYYVRIIPVDERGQIVGLPSDTAVVWYGTPPKSEFPFKFPAPQFVPVEVKVLRYDPLRNSKPYYFIVTRKPPALFPWKVGDKIYLPPSKDDDGWFDKVTESVGDVVEYTEGAVNWVADAYDDLKAEVVHIVAGAIPILGDDLKRKLVGMALDAALVSMGVPPSLPDFDRLVDQGADYLARKIAEDAGIPEEASREVVKRLVEEARKTAAGGKGALNFLRPDPDYAFSWPRLVIQVTRPANSPADKENVKYVDIGDKAGLLSASSIAIPQLKPGESVTIPVILSPIMKLTPAKLGEPEYLDETDWHVRYATTTCSFVATAYVGWGYARPEMGTFEHPAKEKFPK